MLYTDSHIFLTGRAGTGKTTFLRNLRAKTYKRMVVVAPTGVAAINAGGQTPKPRPARHRRDQHGPSRNPCTLLQQRVFLRESRPAKNILPLRGTRSRVSATRRQRAKAVAVLEAEKKSKSKVSIKDDLKGNALYKQLHAWRAERADELDVEVYRIVPTTALKAIAKEKPVTLRELKAVKGMGDKRVKQFGAEILDIILRSLGQSPDESPSPVDPDMR